MYRIKIEILCTDCEGKGKVEFMEPTGSTNLLTCSGCDGEGFQEIPISLKAFSNLLEDLKFQSTFED